MIGRDNEKSRVGFTLGKESLAWGGVATRKPTITGKKKQIGAGFTSGPGYAHIR